MNITKNKNFWFNNDDKARFICIDNKNFIPFFSNSITCNECNSVVYKPKNSFISQCEVCKTLISFFKPSPIQLAASLSRNKILLNLGGYGSGKTTISAYILSSMMRQIPKSRIVCVAQTKQQLERTAILELEKFIHKSEFKQKKQYYWEFINGSVVEFWPSDDAEKLKSLNVNFVWLVEATNYKMKLIYDQAISRIRAENGFIYNYDDDGNIVMKKTKKGVIKPDLVDSMNMVLVEANPLDGSWTNHLAYTAHTVIHTPNVRGLDILKQQVHPTKGHDEDDDIDVNVDVACVLNATCDNPLLPASYMVDLRGTVNTQEDYDRIVYCDITSKKGLVFKDVIANEDQYFKPVNHIDLFDKDNFFVEAFDPAGSNINNDPEAYILGLFNKRERRLVILDGYKLSGLNLTESLNNIWALRRKWGWTKQRHLLFVADNALGKSFKTNNNVSLKNDYELGLSVGIQLCDDKAIAAGIRQVKEWLNNQAIIFPQRFGELKNELFTYTTFEKLVVRNNNDLKYKEEFSESNNHLMDALRYLIVSLEHYGFRQIDLKQLQDIGNQISPQFGSLNENNSMKLNPLGSKLYSLINKK